MKEIPLSGPYGQGRALLVDDEDYEFMSRFKWHARKDRKGYIRVTATVAAHNLLVPYALTDHANGNTLDNTRTNLREATHRQNSMNRGRRSDCQSRYKGVRFDPKRKMFRARIQVGEKRLYGDYFESEIDAARAYDAMAREHFGEFARLNFPDEPNHAPPQPSVRCCARPGCGKEFRNRRASIYCSRGCADFMAMPNVLPIFADAWGRRPKTKSRSGYKGVNWSGEKTRKWQVRIMRDGKRVFLGNFDTPEEAARAYDAAARELFGEHAWLNFPDEAGVA